MRRYVLPNGLVVIVQPIEHAVSASVGLWIQSGSREERPDEYGYAHFVEHMLFKGTSRFSALEMARVIDRVGGQHNAATNKEYTCFYINIMSDYIQTAVDILSDMFYNPLFDETEIEREKEVVLEEIRMYEDTPDEHIHDLFTEAVFNNHPLAHQILGTVDTVGSITRDRLLSFYETHYTTSNTVLVAAGKIDGHVFDGLIQSYFSGSRTSAERLPIQQNPPKRRFSMHIPRELEQVHFCMGVDGFPKTSCRRWPLFLISTVLGGSMSSRLFQRLREQEGLCYSVYSFHSSYKDAGLFGIYCGTSLEKYERAVKLILDELDNMVHKGIGDSELADAKTLVKGNLALSLESIEVRMGQLARDEINFGRFYSFDEIVANVFAVSRQDIMETLFELFAEKRLTHVSIGKNENVQHTELTVT
ncbi:MAG: M16 family metallopeptidase [Spirochaetota bacterium]